MTKSCYLLKNCVDYIVSTFTHIFHEHVLMDAHVPRGPQFPGRILSNTPSEPDSYLTVNFHLYWLDSHVSKLCFIIATVMTTIFHITLFHMFKICHQNFIYTVKKMLQYMNYSCSIEFMISSMFCTTKNAVSSAERFLDGS